jgi:hypothetical protein
MRKVISLSVWGTNNRYRIGALKNIELAYDLYPDWEIYLYTDNSEWVHNNDRIKIIELKEAELPGWFWRFLPYFEINGYVISRDADSRFSEREVRAVKEWLLSGKKFSIIKDHVRHFDFPILAGMWGAKAPLNIEILNRINEYKHLNHYLIDQEFLAKEIWPVAQNDVIVHDILSTGWLKETRDAVGSYFIGQGYDEYERPIYPRD